MLEHEGDFVAGKCTLHVRASCIHQCLRDRSRGSREHTCDEGSQVGAALCCGVNSKKAGTSVRLCQIFPLPAYYHKWVSMEGPSSLCIDWMTIKMLQ